MANLNASPTPRSSRDIYDRTTIFWSWLFPLSYLIHIAEEYWGGEGFPAYIFKLRGVYMSPARFLVAQGVGLVLVTIGIVVAQRLKFLPMMLVILGSTVVGNAVIHSIAALITFTYGPGLISSVFVWGPLGIATIIHFKSRIRKQKQYWIAIAIGAGINFVVGILTMRGGRII